MLSTKERTAGLPSGIVSLLMEGMALEEIQ
jgi:hypothetical protein